MTGRLSGPETERVMHTGMSQSLNWEQYCPTGQFRERLRMAMYKFGAIV